MKMIAITLLLLIPSTPLAARRHYDVHPKKVEPSWLHRYVPSVPYKTVDVTTATCHYKPIFGGGDPEAHVVVSLTRYGEVTVDPHGECKTVSYPREEQIYVVLTGNGIMHYGDERVPVHKDDFMYLAPGVAHAVANSSARPLLVWVTGFRIPHDIPITSSITTKLKIANIERLKEQVLRWHGPTVRYKLLVSPRGGQYAIHAGYVVTSLFWMDFSPGGTNFPHHHPNAEEFYLLLHGHGQMVAGGGMNGVEGLHPAKPGDAYYFRQNCTVGFYSSKTGDAQILAVRSLVPPFSYLRSISR